MPVRSSTFTTYINAQTDPNLEQAFARQTRVATASYATISQAAERATRATAGLLKGTGTAGLAQTNRALDQQARAYRASTSASASAERQAARTTEAVRREGGQARSAAQDHRKLAQGLETTATAFSTVQGRMGPVAGRLTTIARAARELTGLQIGLAGVGAALFAIGQTGSEFVNLKTRLRPYFETQKEVNAEFSRTVGIANETRSALEPIVGLYTRLTAVGKEFGLSQDRIARATELASKAATLSGGSAQNRQAGLAQFAQAVGSGRLNGDELRSLIENIPELANAIAKGFKNADGSIGVAYGSLKKLGMEGKLSTNEILDALDRSAGMIEMKFAKLPVTLSSATQQFKNAALVTVGGLDESLQLTNSLATALAGVARNLSTIAALAGGVGAAFAASKVQNFAQGAATNIAGRIARDREATSAIRNGTASAITPAGREAAITKVAEAEAAAAKRSADAQVFSSQRIVEQRRIQLAVAEQNLAAEEAAAAQPVSGRSARTPGLEAAVEAARAEQAAVRDTIATRQDATRQGEVDRALAIRNSKDKVIAAEQEVAAIRSVERADRQRLNAAKTADTLIRKNPNLDDGQRERLLTRNTQELTQAQLAHSRSSTILQGATGRLTTAQESLRRSTVAYSVARRTANQSAQAGFASLRQAEGAAKRVAVAERQLAEATRATVAAQKSGNLAVLTAATVRRSAALARLRLAEMQAGEATRASTAANRAATTASSAAAAAQAVLSRSLGATQRGLALLRGGLLASIRSLASLNVAVGIATAALLIFGNQTAAADRNLQVFNKTQDDVAEAFGRMAAQTSNATRELREYQRTKILASRQERREATVDQFSDARRKITRAGQTAIANGDVQLARQLFGLANSVNENVRIEDIVNRYSRLERGARGTRGAAAFGRGQNILGVDVSVDTSSSSIRGSLETAAYLRHEFNKGVAEGEQALHALNETAQRTGVVLPRSFSAGELRARGLAEAASGAGETIAGVNARLKVGLDDLNREFGVDKGKVPSGREAEYQQRATQLYQTANAERQAIKDAAAGAAAGRSAERRAATQARQQAAAAERDRIQDAKDAAGAKRDAGLLDLETRKPQLSQDEYLRTRIAILSTYDEEVNALDESAAASSAASAQMIRDAKAVAKASERSGSKRDDILSGYDDTPDANDKASRNRDTLQGFVETAVDGIAFLNKTEEEIREIAKLNPLGTGIYTQEMADADGRRIEEGLRKPLRDLDRDADREVQLANLLLQGRNAEADALRQKFQLLDSGLTITRRESDGLIYNAQQQERINDLLGERNRVTSLITGAVDDSRESFERFLIDLPNGAAKATGSLFKSFRDRFVQIQARSLTEKIFSGADEKVRALISGKSAIDTATGGFVTTMTTAETGVDRLATSFETAAARIDAVADDLANGGGAAGASADDIGATVASAIAGPAAGAGASLVGGLAQIIAQGFEPAPDPENPNAVIITAPKAEQAVEQARTELKRGTLPRTADLYGELGKSLGANIDDALHGIFGSGKRDPETGRYATDKAGVLGLGKTGLFKDIGAAVGGALQGAGQGSIASGFAKALGIRQSGTGASIGGAIGNFLPIPGGGFIGGLVGGTLGGLFGKPKPKVGAASITTDEFGNLNTATSGRGAQEIAAAKGTATTVIDGIQSIAQALGATITGSPDVTIGTYNGKYRVNTAGTTLGGIKGKQPSSLTNFDDDQQAAVEYAIRFAIENSVISGISQASKNIIKSGQSLQAAIEKATIIESIPKRLMQREDPVRFAITTLNQEFSRMISILKESGATAQQFADAQRLYEMERADAIEQATKQAGDAIDQFLRDMVGGSSSPLNKRTVYEAAGSELDRFKGDITSGKLVDQNDLLAAARNFQEASRSLNGSSSAFFGDFDALRALLEKARTNAGMTDVTTLPASPFTGDASVQAAIASLQASGSAVAQTQTDALVSKLDEVVRAIDRIPGYAANDTTGYARESGTLGLLPGFSTA